MKKLILILLLLPIPIYGQSDCDSIFFYTHPEYSINDSIYSINYNKWEKKIDNFASWLDLIIQSTALDKATKIGIARETWNLNYFFFQSGYIKSR
ncbi:MAG: hypothetical protein RO257_01565 [Candidatus Kapabacteria bacterium]|nr:hypothetical protein [Candidatus Kapabacteria bacterium]